MVSNAPRVVLTKAELVSLAGADIQMRLCPRLADRQATHGMQCGFFTYAKLSYMDDSAENSCKMPSQGVSR